MNKNIVMQALRQLILNVDSMYVTNDERTEALNELLRIQRLGTINHDLMQYWRQFRTNNDRITTIKKIRTDLDCGLSEALIIVKGIESHDNILT